MPLRFLNDQYALTANTPVTNGQTVASLSMWVRIEPEHVACPEPIFLFCHRGYETLTVLIAANRDNRAEAWTRVNDGTKIDGVAVGFDVVKGQAFHVAIACDATGHRFYLNGSRLPQMNNASGALGYPGQPARPISLGLQNSYGRSNTGQAVTIDEPTLWSGYALTDADIRNLVNRTAHPEGIAPDRVAWRLPLNGTAGAAAAPGDAAIADGSGGGAGLITFVGGAPRYLAGVLTYTPPARVRSAIICPSRKGLLVTIEDQTGALSNVKTLPGPAPVLTINGGPPLTLGTPSWGARSLDPARIPPYYPTLYYPLPAAVPVGAAATLDAPRGFAYAEAGEVAAMAAFRVDTSDIKTILPAFPTAPAKTMAFGYNIICGEFNQPAMTFADLAKTSSGLYYPGATYVKDARGYPVSGNYNLLRMDFCAPIYNDTDAKGYRSFPPSGVWTVKWDGTANVVLSRQDPASTYLNLDASGNLAVQAESVGAATGNFRKYLVNVDPAQRNSPWIVLQANSLDLRNLRIYPPGIDTENPPVFHPEMKRMLGAAKSIRFMDALKTNSSSKSEIEDFTHPDDLSYSATRPFTPAAIASLGPGDAYLDMGSSRKGVLVLATCNTPHGIKSGQIVTINLGSATAGPNGNATLPLVGGGTTKPLQGQIALAFAISPTQLVFGVDSLLAGNPAGTLAGTYSGAALGPAPTMIIYPERGWPIARCVDLCNETGAVPWLNLPHAASDACVTAFGDLVARRLRRDLKCRFEYSNECWNFGAAFIQSAYCIVQGAILQVVGGFTITSVGTGYTSAPTVTLTGGGGSDATARATIFNGQISKIIVVNEGTGYTSAPTVTITGGGGSGAAATARRGLNGLEWYMRRSDEVRVLLEAAFVAAGRPASDLIMVIGTQATYAAGSTAPMVEYAARNGLPIHELAVSPYLSNHPSPVTGGHSEPALLSVFDSLDRDQLMDTMEIHARDGRYEQGITDHRPILDAAGYTSTPIVAYEGGPETGLHGWTRSTTPTVAITGDGAGAAATVAIDDATGRVTGVTVTAGGSGYTSASATIVGGNGGSGCVLRPVLAGGAIASMAVTDGGANYLTAAGWNKRLGRRVRSTWRDPRVRGCILHWLQRFQDSGCSLFNIYTLIYPVIGNYGVYQMHWGTYFGFDMKAGMGDGSDGLFDNRTDTEDYARLVSVPGGAYERWMALYAAPEAGAPPVVNPPVVNPPAPNPPAPPSSPRAAIAAARRLLPRRVGSYRPPGPTRWR